MAKRRRKVYGILAAALAATISAASAAYYLTRDPRGRPGEEMIGDVLFDNEWDSKRYLRVRAEDRIYELCDNWPFKDTERNQSRLDTINVYDEQGNLIGVHRDQHDYVGNGFYFFTTGTKLNEQFIATLNDYYSKNWRKKSKLRKELHAREEITVDSEMPELKYHGGVTNKDLYERYKNHPRGRPFGLSPSGGLSTCMWKKKMCLFLELDDKIYKLCDEKPIGDIEPGQSRIDKVSIYDKTGKCIDSYRLKFSNPFYVDPEREVFKSNRSKQPIDPELLKRLKEYYQENWREEGKWYTNYVKETSVNTYIYEQEILKQLNE